MKVIDIMTSPWPKPRLTPWLTPWSRPWLWWQPKSDVMAVSHSRNVFKNTWPAMWAIWAEIMGKRQGLQLRSENLHCNSPKKLLYINLRGPDSHQQCKKVIMFWKIGKNWLKGSTIGWSSSLLSSLQSSPGSGAAVRFLSNHGDKTRRLQIQTNALLRNYALLFSFYCSPSIVLVVHYNCAMWTLYV